MRVRNRHERSLPAPPELIAEIVADFGRIWPRGPVPRLVDDRVYDTGGMLWQEYDRPAAARAFRVLRPGELHLDHWFGVEAVAGATVLSHTIEGHAVGTYETIWRDRIEPEHDAFIEELFDRIRDAAAPPA